MDTAPENNAEPMIPANLAKHTLITVDLNPISPLDFARKYGGKTNAACIGGAAGRDTPPRSSQTQPQSQQGLQDSPN